MNSGFSRFRWFRAVAREHRVEEGVSCRNRIAQGNLLSRASNLLVGVPDA
jgi:hypothetical protein